VVGADFRQKAESCNDTFVMGMGEVKSHSSGDDTIIRVKPRWSGMYLVVNAVGDVESVGAQELHFVENLLEKVNHIRDLKSRVRVRQ
jgi:hypothetical protein